MNSVYIYAPMIRLNPIVHWSSYQTGYFKMRTNNQNQSHHKAVYALGVLLVAGLLVAAFIGSMTTSPAPVRELAMAPMADMPEFVQNGSSTTQHTYRFAVMNHDLLDHFECYCGCGAIGHTSNADCYIQNIAESGEITYDLHATGCGICQEITLDVMRLWEQGWELADIQTYIVANYSYRGPST